MTALHVTRLDNATLLQVRGSGSLAALAAENCEVPEEWFTYRRTAALNTERLDFVARLGTRECLLLAEADDRRADRIAAAGVADTYVFQRDDTLLRVEGDHWAEMMLQVCSYDLCSALPPQFVMTSAAGISIWMRIPAAGEPLLIGCDPSFGHYLVSTLEQITQDFNYTCNSGGL